MFRFCAGLGHLFTEVDLPARFSCALEAGFDGVELTLPYEWPAPQLAAARRDSGAPVVGLTAPVGDFLDGGEGLAAVPGRSGEFRRALDVALEYAVALQADWVHVVAGRCLDPARLQTYRATLVENLRTAAAVLADSGLQLLVEPINRTDFPDFIISSPALARGLLSEVGTPMGCILDTHHLAQEAIDPAREIADHAGCFAHVQLADWPLRRAPGLGELDFDRFFEALRASGYSGWVGAEYHPTAAGELAWLQQARDYLNS